MLRQLIVLAVLLTGAYYSLQGPFYALLLYVWNAYFRPESWVWSSGWLLSLKVSYLAGIVVVVSTLFSKERFRLPGHAVLLLLILAHSLISTLLCQSFESVWPTWTSFLKALTITMLMPTLVSDRKKLRLLLFVMCFSLGFEGAKQGWVQLVLNPGGVNSNDIPFLGDNNGVAVGMLMLAPLIGSLAATTSSKWLKRFCYFLVVGVIYRALSTYSRGGFLSCGTLALIYWLRSKEKFKLGIGFAVAALIVLPALPQEFWSRMNTIKTYEEVGETSALSRFHFWKVAAKMGTANPFFGVGFDAYNYTYDKYDFSFGDFGQARSVHSAWFGVLAELGYVGLGLYVLNLFFGLRNCAHARKVARRLPEYGDLQRFATSIETSLCVFVVGGSFLPFQYNEMLWHVIGISIALKSITRSIDSAALASQSEEREKEAQFEFQGAGATFQ